MVGRGIAHLFANGSADLGFRVGTLVTWNTSTAVHTIDVAGTTFTNLPVGIPSTAWSTLAAGDVVFLIRAKNQYFIAHKIYTP